MTVAILLQLMALPVFMLGGAFFSGIETGAISINRLRLRHLVRKGAPGARIIFRFVQEPDRLFGTTLVGTNICMVAVSVLAASAAMHLIGAWGETLSTVVMALLVVVFCEYLPKAWFHSRPYERVRPFAPLLRLASFVLRPVSVTVVLVSRLLVRGPSKTFSAPAPFLTREDLKQLARDSEKGGALSPRERFMIHRVMELSGRQVGQIMVPLEKITRVSADTKFRDFRDVARESGFTRIPVFDRERGAFSGVINVFHVLSQRDLDPEQPVGKLARPPLVVPESMPVDEILPRMRRAGQAMCLVAGADGRVTGLVTTEDVLREIVGPL